MLTQLQPVTEKIHASLAPQKPLQSGALASPHAVVRHSHAPPDTRPLLRGLLLAVAIALVGVLVGGLLLGIRLHIENGMYATEP